MKILQISKFYPPVMGGIESVAYELAEGSRQRGHTMDVLCANTVNTTVHESAASGYAVTRAASLGKFLSTSMAPALITQLRKIAAGYDVIHVQMPDPMAALALWVVRPKARIVLHWQSDVVNQRRALRLYEPLQGWLLQRADAIIATTPPYAASSVPLQPWQRKVHIIPNGISEPAQRHEAIDRIRQRLGGKRMVFSLGRMTYYKGFGQLLDVAASLPLDTVIVVGGAGELLTEYRQAVAARGLGDRLQFIGRVADEEVYAYLALTELFCLPSIARSEAYGVVLLEAMAMGKALLTTDIPGSGVPWVNQDGVTGVTVPVNDVAALARAMNAMLENPLQRAAFGAAGRQRFLQELTAERMVSRVVELYQALLASH